MENRLAKNRKSPRNEQDYVNAYLKKVPSARKEDGMDVSAVTTKDGTKGHALFPENINRSHDNGYHIAKNFIPDSELK